METFVLCIGLSTCILVSLLVIVGFVDMAREFITIILDKRSRKIRLDAYEAQKKDIVHGLKVAAKYSDTPEYNYYADYLMGEINYDTLKRKIDEIHNKNTD